MKEKGKKELLDMNSRVRKVKCCGCGKEIEIPNMYAEEREKLVPFCCATTVLIVQWLIYHGWHVTTNEVNPPGAFFCQDCFPKGQAEYHRGPSCETWVKQAEAWMKENNGKQ